MAQNDMYVVMYKIIAYLYDCMKRGAEPSEDGFSASAMGIPEPYWTQIMSELVEHRFVEGVKVERFLGGKSMVSCFQPRVTMEGVAFAQENSMMAKAKAFLQDAKSAVPFI